MNFVVAACAVSVVSFGGAAAERALGDGLEYDQIVFHTPDVAAHPPGSFDSDLTAVKTASLNGELGTVASRKRMLEMTKIAQDPARKIALMAASQIPFLGTMGALIATNALRAKFLEEGKTMGNSATHAYQTEHQ